MSIYLNLPILPPIILVGFNPKMKTLEIHTLQGLQPAICSPNFVESGLKSSSPTISEYAFIGFLGV